MQQLLLPFPGAIPESIGNLVSLQGLGLSGNDITGKAGLAPERDMQQLLLRFPGAIPESIGNLVSLTDLYLQGNAINGKAALAPERDRNPSNFPQ